MDNNLALLIFLAVLGLGSAQVANNNIFCYNCNPSTHSAAACASPVNNVPLVNCSTLVVGNWTFNCYSEFLNYNNVSGNAAWNNRTGIYRGCVAFTTGQNTWCSRFLEANVTRLSCGVCVTTGCNTHTFNTGGGITGGGTGGGGGGGIGGGGGGPGGASAILPSLFVLITCIIISYKNNYN